MSDELDKQLRAKCQEMTKKLLEAQEEYAYQRRKAMANSSGACASPLKAGPSEYKKNETTLSRYRKELEYIAARKQQIVEIIDDLEKIPYSQGDIVVHPKFGTCVVHDVQTKKAVDGTQDYMHSTPRSDIKDEDSILIQSGGFSYPIWVPISDVVPHTASSKVLFEKKKG